MLPLQIIQLTSISRASRWHEGGVSDWSTLEWSGAMSGEAGETCNALLAALEVAKVAALSMAGKSGEACNAAKKLKRVQDKIKNINLEPGRSITEIEEANLKVAREVCDTILYAVLVAASVGYVGEAFEEVLCDVFNQKSFEYDFPERLPFYPSHTDTSIDGMSERELRIRNSYEAASIADKEYLIGVIDLLRYERNRLRLTVTNQSA